MRHNNFTILPEPACPWLYFVSEETIIPELNAKGKKNKHGGETMSRNVAYGCNLAEAIDIIAHLSASKDTFEGFLKEYKQALAEMTKQVTKSK